MFSPAPAQGATYSPGTATAYKVAYNWVTGNYDYHCAFDNWRSGANVQWKCELHEIYSGPIYVGGLYDQLVSTKSGSWTPGSKSKTTLIYSFPANVGQGQFCIVARALSVDGGVSQRKCN